jgi:hypothetical protein
MRGLGSSAGSCKAGWTWYARCGPSAQLRLTRMAPGYLWTGPTRFFRWEGLMRAFNHKTGIWSLYWGKSKPRLRPISAPDAFPARNSITASAVKFRLGEARRRLEHDQDRQVL